MSATAKRTFRVRNLPSHVDRMQAVELLLRLNNSLGPSENIIICSLASSLNPWERPPTKMATVMFLVEPPLFQNNQSEWVLPAKNFGFYYDITIDIHFLGFTVLNEVDPRNYVFDCIAISGLASHPFGSWKQRNETTNFMWLRDRLPRDMPYVRSIIYGYNTELLNSESTQTIDDLATSLIIELKIFGRSATSSKPLAFFAHSLGGIILKRALVLLAESGPLERFMLDCVRQIVLFGVPHQGMTIAHLLPMVQKQPNQSLVKFIATDSVQLKGLGEQFDGITIIRNVQIVSVYETKRSRLPQETSDGTWSRDGPYELLVNRDSAVHKSSLPANTLPINEDHSNMVKFADGDVGYRGVLSFLFELKQRLEVSSQEPSVLSEFSFEILEPAATSMSVEALDSPQRVAQKRDLGPARNYERPNTDITLESRLKEMMKSLGVFSDERRQHGIQDATANTFNWIYTNEALKFASWTSSGCGLYWIRGKPGSGKSTLMKYIYRDPRTQELLCDPRNLDRRNIKASFFFHDRGSYLQKSFEGLLGSVLHQILREEPLLQKVILPPANPRVQALPWTLEDLERAFKSIVDQEDLKITISLFLDALDEFDGPPELIVSWINLLSGNHNRNGIQFQICFSSRPLNIFVDKLDHCPGFKIHEYTKDDIRKFTVAKFEESEALKSIFKSEMDLGLGGPSELIDEIIVKAQGVFLWVRLMMRELHLDAVDGATRKELFAMLTTFPDDLEAFYNRILEKIPGRYRFETYVMIELALRSEEPLELDIFDQIVACAQFQSFRDCQMAIKGHGKVKMPFRAELRLRSRSGGLLEVVRTRSSSKIPIVQFMHQTVKEFAEKPNFRKHLLGDKLASASENGHSFLTKYFLTALVSTSLARIVTSYDDIGEFTPAEHIATLIEEKITRKVGLDFQCMECSDHASLAESTTGKAQQQFLDSFDDQLIAKAFKFHTVINSVASFAVASGLVLYVRERLRKPQFVNSNPEISLLHCAALTLERHQVILRSRYEHMLSGLKQILRLLLHSGANKIFVYRGMNPFQVIVNGLSTTQNSARRAELVEIAEMFLDSGQDPNTPITVEMESLGRNSRIERFDRKLKSGTALHTAPLRLLQALLRKNANVNALTEDGLTPLDCRLILAPELKRDNPEYAEAYEAILILMQHGGKMTSNTEKQFAQISMRFNVDFGDSSLLRQGPHLLQHLEPDRISDDERDIRNVKQRRHSAAE